MAERELTMTAAEVLPGDHLDVGHHWWGRVKRANRSEALNVTVLEVGGMNFLLMLLPEQPVVVRRHNDGQADG